MKKRVTIYWLIPAKPEWELFRDIIRILAGQFDGPRFEPHLTLCKVADEQSSRRLLRQIRAAPIRLRIRDVSHSSNFTRTLFVRFAPDKALQRLVVNLGGKPGSLPNPHISLLYKKLPASTRRELAAAIKLPFREVTFDRIEAMRCVSPTESRRDVESWHRLATKRFSG